MRSGWFRESHRHSLAAQGVRTNSTYYAPKRPFSSLVRGITRGSASLFAPESAQARTELITAGYARGLSGAEQRKLERFEEQVGKRQRAPKGALLVEDNEIENYRNYQQIKYDATGDTHAYKEAQLVKKAQEMIERDGSRDNLTGGPLESLTRANDFAQDLLKKPGHSDYVREEIKGWIRLIAAKRGVKLAGLVTERDKPEVVAIRQEGEPGKKEIITLVEREKKTEKETEEVARKPFVDKPVLKRRDAKEMFDVIRPEKKKEAKETFDFARPGPKPGMKSLKSVKPPIEPEPTKKSSELGKIRTKEMLIRRYEPNPKLDRFLGYKKLIGQEKNIWVSEAGEVYKEGPGSDKEYLGNFIKFESGGKA